MVAHDAWFFGMHMFFHKVRTIPIAICVVAVTPAHMRPPYTFHCILRDHGLVQCRLSRAESKRRRALAYRHHPAGSLMLRVLCR